MKKFYIFIFILLALPVQFIYSQWVQQIIPTQVHTAISGIKFVNLQTGWAVSRVFTQQDTTFILHTSNSGSDWFIQYTGVKQTFNTLWAVNDSIVYAGGTDYQTSPSSTALLLKTTNGGINWNRMTIDVFMHPYDMQFVNKDSGWVCCLSAGPDVRTTTDGGLTWQVRMNGINNVTQRIFFLNYNTGFCGAYSTFYKTTNAGMNWVQIGSFSQDPRSIYFLNENTGWIGTDGNKIYYTSNSGINWNLQILPPNSGSTVYDLFFININTGWGGTGFNKIFKTTNGGINWGYQEVTTGSYRISIIDSLNCWAGYFGISHTTNGGGPILDVKKISNKVPEKFKLYQNYPNPFNPSTTIKLDVPNATYINLIICDILGRELYTIANEYLKTGTYTFTWNASKYSSGIYFYRLITEQYTETKKMLMIK